jgi:hypothetical protein
MFARKATPDELTHFDEISFADEAGEGMSTERAEGGVLSLLDLGAH